MSIVGYWIALFVCGAAIGPVNGSRDDTLRVTNVEVVAGEPFGVGKVTFEPGSAEAMLELSDGYHLSDTQRRILYPVLAQRFIDRVIDATGSADPFSSRLTYWFLVRGDQPLQLRLSGLQTVEFNAEVQPVRGNAARRLLRQWWREYSASARQKTSSGELPPLVESYMVAMLAQRLGLETERLSGDASERDPLRQTLDLVFDTESLKSRLMFDLMLHTQPPDAGRQLLPEPIAWLPAPRLAEDGTVAVEPLATAVPAECFYLRFGNWQNQLWLKRLMAEYGGDFSRLIGLRGYKSPASQDRMMNQLALEPTKWDDLFGGNVIADLAVIGTDTLVADGASIGILFEAKNPLFARNLSGRRAQVAKDRAGEGVRLEEVQLDGHPATFLNAPDQRVRSFLVSREPFHLVTTSETLARRFLAALDGVGSLANEPSFLNARRINPIERDDTIFLFVSEHFFHQLLSPKNQIELRRRAYVQATDNVWRCATWAAAVEGLAWHTPADLIQAGLLPPHFVVPPSASETAGVGPRIQPSLPPLADVHIQEVSDQEAAWFRERAAYFARKIGRFDPLVIAIKRFSVDERRERLAIDARLSPFSPGKYDWLGTLLGPPTADQLTAGSNDVLTLQVSLQQIFQVPQRTSNQYQLFLAIQNDAVPGEMINPQGFLDTVRSLRQIPGYLMAWPHPGILNSIPMGFRGRPDEQGFTYSRLLDMWRLEGGEYTAFSFDRTRLEAHRELWQRVPGERMAQLRLRVGDLSQSRLSGLANAYFYRRAWDASRANVQLVNQLRQQFFLDAEQAWTDAERLLDVRLVCPLGGEYELRDVSPGRTAWVSTAWPDDSPPRLPADYSAPIFNWFRGLSADVIQTDDQFVVHGVLDVQRNVAADESPLPSFDLFKGFQNITSLSGVLGKDDQADPPPKDSGDQR